MNSWRARRDTSSAGSLFIAGVLALLCSACTSGPAQGTNTDLSAPEARALAIADADPRWRPTLEALRAAVDAGDDREARAVLSRLYQSEPTGTALDVARAYERILDGRADPRWRPALEALRAAVDAGNELEARAVLARLYLTEPTGAALELARAFERILDGRAAVASLDLALEAEFERTPSGAGVVVVWFRARTEDPRAFDVAPGPCTLLVTQTAVDAAGDETRSLETMPVAAPIRVLLKDKAPVRIPLAHMAFGARPGGLASRVSFELNMRAGTVSVDDRELPAQRFQIAGGEVVLLAKELASLELTSAGALTAHVADGKCDAKAALSIAVRLPRSERPAALDALARTVETIPEPALRALTPALRWVAPDEDLGRDPDSWRSFLRRRARSLEKRPDLILPRPKPNGLAGS